MNNLPYISSFDSIKTLITASFYLFALGIYYFFLGESKNERLKKACLPLLLIIPLIIPFFLITFFFDLVEIFSYSNFSSSLLAISSDLTGSFILFTISAFLMALLFIFLPPVIIKIWQCKPLEKSPLKDRLEALCQKAKFKHAGMQTWTIMNNNFTAAIIGVLPRFRYVMFTRKLLAQFSPESIETILAHEIGHSYHKHLIIFPFIIMGMVVILGLFSSLFGEGVAAWFALKDQDSFYGIWTLAYPFFIFLVYVVIISLYFRLIFGLFSRLFERQADLHVFKLGLDPLPMIEALKNVVEATGIPASTPNWHHYSIQQRIDFLQSCRIDASLIAKHHHRTKCYLIGYSLLFFLSTCLLLAPQLNFLPFFSILDKVEKEVSNHITQTITKLN